MAQKKTRKEKVIEQFTKIQGVGKAKAETLYEGGYKSLEMLKNATVEELIKVKGVGKSFAEKLYNNLKNEKKMETIEEKIDDDGWDEDESWDENETEEKEKKIETKKAESSPGGGIIGNITGIIGKTIGSITGLFNKGKKVEEEKKGVAISESPKKPAPPNVEKATKTGKKGPSKPKKPKTTEAKKTPPKTKKVPAKTTKAPPKTRKGKPRGDIIEEFTSIPGIGASKAEALYNAGFRTTGELKRSSIKKLTEVKGISAVVAKKIKEELK